MTVAYDTIGDVRFLWHMKTVQIREMKGMREHITHYDQMDTVITMEPRDFLFVAHLQETMTNSQLREYIISIGSLLMARVHDFLPSTETSHSPKRSMSFFASRGRNVSGVGTGPGSATPRVFFIHLRHSATTAGVFAQNAR